MAAVSNGDAVVAKLMEATQMQRRSAISYNATTLPPTNPSTIRPTMQSPSPLALHLHFLKERSATMHDNMLISTQKTQSAVQSNASAFLVGLVERSRTTGGFFDQGSHNQEQIHTHRKGALSGDASERSSLFSMPHNRQSSTGSDEPTGVPKWPATTGPSALDIDIDHDYVSGYELNEKTTSELVADLTVYKRCVRALTVILQELHRRLLYAEMECGDHSAPTVVKLCKRIWDDGVLSSVILVMREFLFRAELQTAAITLLSFIADISDLYAFMMVELDLEPLIQKIVSVHVSQERLVMLGSSLFHSIAPSKHKPEVIKMHKAKKAEEEKRRATKFAKAFTAELSAFKAKSGSARKRSGSISSDIHGEEEVGRVRSQWQRRVLSGQLGAPPILTAHYELSTARKTTQIPPLPGSSSTRPRSHDGREDRPNAVLFLDEMTLARPVTSPEPRTQRVASLTLSPAAAKTAAIYSQSPVLVAPTPSRKRLVSSQRSKRSTASSVKMRIERNDSFVCVDGGDVSHFEVGDGQDNQGEQANHDVGAELAGTATPLSPSPDPDQPEDEELSYTDDDDFAAEERSACSSPPRLLAIDSDSELLIVVEERGQTPRVDTSELEEPQDAERLLPVDSDGEFLTMIDPHPVDLVDDPATTETSPSMRTPATASVSAGLVDLLSSCVDTTQDPTTQAQFEVQTLESIHRSSRRQPRTKKEPPRSRSPLVATWSPPSTIVRPVSRRIMDKATKTTKKRAASTMLHLPSAVAQITSVLEQIDSPVAVKEDEADEVFGATIAGVAKASLPPSSHPPSVPGSIAQIQALYARGLVHHKANELDAAIHCYEAGIALQRSCGVSREFASLFINVGSAYLAQRRLHEALAAFTDAERIQPQNLKTLFNSGLTLMQLGRWQDAASKLEAVTAMDATHTRAQCALDECLRHIVSDTLP